MKFTLGEKCPELAGSEGTLFDLSDTCGILIIRIESPTKKDLDQFGKGSPIRAALTTYKDVILLLFKFGEMPWQVCPFTVHLAPLLKKITPPDSDGYAVNIVVCDTEGLVHKLDLISLPLDISTALFEEMLVQSRYIFDMEAYRINSVVAQISSTPNELLYGARVKTVVRH